MARSENQGIQIALIVFAFMFILATVGFIYYISENSKNVAAAAEATKRASDLEANARQAQEKWNLLCARTGIDPNANVEAITTTWQNRVDPISRPLSKDAQGGDADPATSVDALTTIDKLNEALKKKSKQVQENKTELAALQAELEKLRTDDEKKIADLEKKFNDASAAHQQAVASAKEVEDEQVQKNKELTDSLKERDGQITALQTQLTQQQAASAEAIKKLEDDLENISYQLLLVRNESFTEPDGSIRLVNQQSETVWINLGSEDNLRPQITFSVWEKGSTGLARDGESRKGAIEIMRIEGPHQAEARITQQNPLNPIVPGDVISTPLWRPGEKLGFALVGSLDIDGDSISDRERIVKLIESNGGVLDAEFDPNGMIGEMTVDTRYIIVGKSPAGQEVEVTNMLRAADRLGVQRISLADFLERSGYRMTRETKHFGAGSDAADFDDVPVDNNRFRTRKPPTGVGN